MHSLAFGSLLPFLAEEPKGAISRKQMEMTLDVMANSLVFWVQDLWRAGLLERGSKVYAMTSEGSARTIPSYGAVSAAKAALESHCRQLAMELALLDAGVAVNAIRAGVTETPALRKIPEAARVIEHTLARNPHGRLTTVGDVAEAIVTLASTDSDWINGNVINVDGGEFHTG
jgi:enoyl-[acyl-carrier protein] reductase III